MGEDAASGALVEFLKVESEKGKADERDDVFVDVGLEECH